MSGSWELAEHGERDVVMASYKERGVPTLRRGLMVGKYGHHGDDRACKTTKGN